MNQLAINISTALVVALALGLAVTLRMFVSRSKIEKVPSQPMVAFLLFVLGLVLAAIGLDSTLDNHFLFLGIGCAQMICAGIVYVLARRRS